MLGLDWTAEPIGLARRPLLDVTCARVALAEAAACIADGNELKVTVRRWRRLPRRLVSAVRALEHRLAPEPGNPPPSGRVLRELTALERDLAAHDFGWFLGALERVGDGAPPWVVTVLAAAPAGPAEIVVPIDL
jgi:hypothetical protein